MADTLRLALIHCPVAHGRLADNQALLLALNQKAARRGAQIILNTEMGLSGYGFDSRTEIAPMVQVAGGEVVRAFAELSREHRLYLALGLAERDPRTDIFHNSALLLGPDGKLAARRRKTTAEAKWACPGPARQADLASTPWGKVGLLICSETYFSLIPRALALKGADLLLVPANWPPGGTDPRHLWRVRALENGVHLAACNRTGQDKRLDLGQARSCLFDPWGQDLLGAQPVEPGIFMAEIPLQDGRLASCGERARRLAGRKPGCYHYIYSQLNRIKDLGSYLDLPEPGVLEVFVLGSEAGAPLRAGELCSRLEALPAARHRLAVLPAVDGGLIPPSKLSETAERLEMHLVCQAAENGGPGAIALFSPGQAGRFWPLPSSGPAEPPLADLGPARVGLALAGDLLHPELALAMAKRGCDLVATSAGPLSENQRAVLGLRNLERVTLALAHDGGGLICSPPEGHEAGARLELQGRGERRLALDTSLTRSKAYEERLDYELLLDPDNGNAP